MRVLATNYRYPFSQRIKSRSNLSWAFKNGFKMNNNIKICCAGKGENGYTIYNKSEERIYCKHTNVVYLVIIFFSYLLSKSWASKTDDIRTCVVGSFDTREAIILSKENILIYNANWKDLVTMFLHVFPFCVFLTSSTVKCNESYIKGLNFLLQEKRTKGKENIDYFFLEEGKQTCH